MDLHRQRLIRAAKGGEARALAELWDGCVDTLWSITRALTEDEEQALAVLASLRRTLQVQAPGLSVQRAWRVQAVERLYLLLNQDFRDLGQVLEDAGPARVEGAAMGLEQTPVELRAVFVFHLLGGLSVAEIAEVLGCEAMRVRGARSWVAHRLVQTEGEGR